ncbi:hypothetical protein [Spirosoma sp.]|uniref:hypothetical protein n=1 Tax=Spirosoma sp. TaxID=1899569 RepID=UPI002617F679|nr:hypothetical protein [Spirosoma sp.]MCX6215291.1 hypothetical protein [Spirosoma sp.]
MRCSASQYIFFQKWAFVLDTNFLVATAIVVSTQAGPWFVGAAVDAATADRAARPGRTHFKAPIFTALFQKV